MESKAGKAMVGTLYLCATPIGNLEDITLRALKILESVDLIACEDTRVSAKLLSHFDIHTKTTSYHEHNKLSKGEKILEALQSGKDVALISDAGMPGISDPGEDLVKRCIEESIPYTVIPGASAGISALVLSGISTRRFVFEGFLPKNKKEREEILNKLKNETSTIVLYETPHRIKDSLKELLDFLGNRDVSIVRELTKKHEEINNLTLAEACEEYNKREPKGEYVIIIEGRSKKELEEEKKLQWMEMSVEEHLLKYISEGIEKKDAMKLVAKDRGVSKREIYNALIDNKGDEK